MALLYVPSGHGKQSLAWMWRLAALPLSLRYVPTGQAEQEAEPSASTYSPSPQMEQEAELDVVEE